MDDTTTCCWACEQFHGEYDVCPEDRSALYQDLMTTLVGLADPAQLPSRTTRVLLWAVAQQRIGQLLHHDAITDLASDIGVTS